MFGVGSPPSDVRGLKRRVLLVDNDELILRANARNLRHDYLVVTAMTTTQALACVRSQPTDLAVIDYHLDTDESDGIALVSQIKVIRPEIACAIYTGYAAVPLTVAAMRCGADHVASKDERVLDVLATLEGRKAARARLPTLDAMERELVRGTLAEFGGNKSRTARSLGISRQTLHQKLARWQLKAGK